VLWEVLREGRESELLSQKAQCGRNWNDRGRFYSQAEHKVMAADLEKLRESESSSKAAALSASETINELRCTLTALEQKARTFILADVTLLHMPGERSSSEKTFSLWLHGHFARLELPDKNRPMYSQACSHAVVHVTSRGNPSHPAQRFMQ